MRHRFLNKIADARGVATLLPNKKIRDIDFPYETVVASIVRHDKLLIPHGDTVLHAKDKITVVADIQAEHILEGLFR